MKFHFLISAVLLAVSSLFAQESSANNHNYARTQTQSACENKMLRDLGAKEVLNGNEYKIFLDVVAAFGLNNAPRLYFFPGDGNAYYIAGSVFLDGKGKIIMSQKFVKFMGGAPALKGIMAHEMAHLVADVRGVTGCDQWVLRDSKIEEAADVLAANKVGFNPLRAFLLKVKSLSGGANGEAASRLRALERFEMQKNRQR